MKAVLLCIVGIFCLTHTAYCQWEHIPVPGASPIVVSQYKQLLYGASAYDYYRSTDFGKTWILFNEGLPPTTKVHADQFWYSNGKVYVYPTAIDRTADTSLRGAYYYFTPGDTAWSVRHIQPIRGIYPTHGEVTFWGENTVFASLRLFNDSVKGFYISTDNGASWNMRSRELTPGAGASAYYHQGSRLYTYDLIKNINNESAYRWFYSDDLGNTWTHVTTLPIPDSIGVALYFISDDILIAGHMELNSIPAPERHYFRSTDHGATWQPITLPGITKNPFYYHRTVLQADNLLTWEFDIHGSAPRTLKYISLNNGSTWQAAPFADSSDSYYYLFGHNNTLFVSRGTQILKTDSVLLQSSVASFLLDPTVPFQILASTNESALLAAPLSNGRMPMDSLFYSTNAGTSWEKRAFATGYTTWSSIPWYRSGDKLYATGIETASKQSVLLRSSNNGESWTGNAIAAGAGIHDTIYTVVMVAGDTILLRGENAESSHPELARSYDGGNSWKFFPMPVTGSQLSCHPSELTLLNGKDHYRSTDLGESWQLRSFSSAAPLYTQGLNGFTDGEHWFYTSYDNKQSKTPHYSNTCSLTNGEEWHPVPIPELRAAFLPALEDGTALYGIAYTQSSISDPSEGSMNRCYVSHDSGSSWMALDGGFFDAQSLVSSSEFLYAWGASGIWRYKLNGRSVASHTVKDQGVRLMVFPNPGSDNGMERISYVLPKEEAVKISLYDGKGSLVVTILDAEQAAGSHECSWDARQLNSGSYLLQLHTAGQTVTSTLQLIR